jgi:hypothetical protein
MPQSLSSKLRTLRRSLKSKLKPTTVIDSDHIKLIARHMPMTATELCNLIPASIVASCGDEILKVTVSHARDQDAFEDCVKEIGAFVRGGLPGMDRLNKVYTQIIKHFHMETDVEEIIDACQLYMHQNRLRRKRDTSDDSNELFAFSGSQPYL